MEWVATPAIPNPTTEVCAFLRDPAVKAYPADLVRKLWWKQQGGHDAFKMNDSECGFLLQDYYQRGDASKGWRQKIRIRGIETGMFHISTHKDEDDLHKLWIYKVIVTRTL